MLHKSVLALQHSFNQINMREHFSGYADLNNQEPFIQLLRNLERSTGFEIEAAIAWLATLYCVKRKAQFVVRTVNQTTSFISFSDDTLQKHPVLDALSKAFSLHFSASFLPQIESLTSFFNENDDLPSYGSLVDDYYDFLSLRFGRSGMMDYIQPERVTRIICKILNDHGCNKMYNPFAGMNSYAIEMGNHRLTYKINSDGEREVVNKEDISFLSQEINPGTAALAMLRLDAYRIRRSEVLVEDSVLNWKDCANYDAVVASPPFGMNLRQYDEEIRHYRFVEDFFFEKCSESHPSKLAICIVSPSFCNRSASRDVRQKMVDDGSLYMVIELPKGIFARAGISANIVVRSFDSKNTHVRFIDATKMVLSGPSRSKMLDTRLLESALNNDVKSTHVKLISYDEIRQQDYSLMGAMYYSGPETNDGRPVKRIRDLASYDRGAIARNTHNYAFVLTSDHFSDNLDDALKNTKEGKNAIPSAGCRVHTGDAVVMTYSLGAVVVYIHRGFGEFYTRPNQLTFKVKKNVVSIEYFALQLLQYPILKQVLSRNESLVSIDIDALTALQITIDSNQQIIVDLALKKERAYKTALLKQEAARLGLSSDINDLVHMLGTSFTNQGEVFNYLLSPERNLSEDVALGVSALKEINDYMQRIITSFGQDLSEAVYSRETIRPVEFISQFMKSWNIIGKKEFSLQLMPIDNSLKGITINADADKLKLLLETLLDNTYRHGFNKGDLQVPGGNLAAISLDLVRYQETTFLRFSVMNNGKPLAAGFTINDFITKGRFSKESGNTGLGGNHVYSITKAHGSYLALNSDKEWNFIVDILLPVDSKSIDPSIIANNYESECL